MLLPVLVPYLGIAHLVCEDGDPVDCAAVLKVHL